jgi:hypothetical protein
LDGHFGGIPSLMPLHLRCAGCVGSLGSCLAPRGAYPNFTFCEIGGTTAAGISPKCPQEMQKSDGNRKGFDYGEV